jgi:hypothetical protein
MGRNWIIFGAMLWLLRAAPAFGLPQETRKAWTAADFGGVLSVGLEGHRDFKNGRRFFSSQCA